MLEAIFGSESEQVRAGYTVDDYHDTLKHVLNIPFDGIARVNGQLVDGAHIPRDGDTLEWVKTWGEKGLPWCTVMELSKAYKVPPKRTRKVLEDFAKLHRSCCLPTQNPLRNQPRKLYDENLVKKVMQEARNQGRYKPSPCPRCGTKLRGTSSPRGLRYLKCMTKGCGYSDHEKR